MNQVLVAEKVVTPGKSITYDERLDTSMQCFGEAKNMNNYTPTERNTVAELFDFPAKNANSRLWSNKSHGGNAADPVSRMDENAPVLYQISAVNRVVIIDRITTCGKQADTRRPQLRGVEKEYQNGAGGCLGGTLTALRGRVWKLLGRLEALSLPTFYS